MNTRYTPWLTLAAAILAAGPLQAQVAGNTPYSVSPYQQRQRGYTSADNPYAPGGIYDPYRGSRTAAGAGGTSTGRSRRQDAAAAGGAQGTSASAEMTPGGKPKQHKPLGSGCGTAQGTLAGGGGSGQNGVGSASHGIGSAGSPGSGGMNYGSAASSVGGSSLSSINRRCTNSGTAGLGQSSSSPGMTGQVGGSAANPGQGHAAQMQTQQYQKLQNVPR